MSLDQYKVLVFDCYGTLIDWESGMYHNLAPLHSQPNAPNRSDLFEAIHPHETRIQKETPNKLYPDVLTEVYQAVAKDLKLECDDVSMRVYKDIQLIALDRPLMIAKARAFGHSVGDWPAFEDTAKALKLLHDKGLKLVILSNVDNGSFEGSRKKLESEGGTFDAIYTAEKIGSYKPNLRNFDYAISHVKKDFGAEKDEILIVANSKYHDVQPAHEKGLKATWIDRPSAVMGVSSYTDVHPDWRFDSMISFAQEITKGR